MHAQHGGQQAPQGAASEGAAAVEKQQPASQGNGSNGAADGQAPGQGGQDYNGAPTSAGLPIAPLRLDSGLQVC